MRTATLAAFTLALMVTTPVPAAEAATITVGVAGCTLADAIAAANTDGPSGTCTGAAITGAFSPGGADTIVLTGDVTLSVVNNGVNGLPVVTSDIAISGNGFTIQRNLAFACPGGADPNFRIFAINGTGARLELNDVTLRNGCITGATFGGAIVVEHGSVEINRSTIKDNQAMGGFGGGLAVAAVSNATATGTVIDSAFVNNKASFGGASATETPGAPASAFLTYISSTLTGNSATGGGWRGGHCRQHDDRAGHDFHLQLDGSWQHCDGWRPRHRQLGRGRNSPARERDPRQSRFGPELRQYPK